MSDNNRGRRPSCIVLGGGGFVGVNLCRRLVASGCRVRALGRRCLFPDALAGVQWLQGDFTDPAALAAAMENFSTVFHLVRSSTPQTANLDMAEDVRRNVIASLAMLEICRKLRGARIVFVSSGGTVYGRAQQIPTPETAPTEPITAHGISKLAIEKYLGLYEYLHGLDYRVLRVANPYGPFQLPTKNHGVIAAMIARALRNEALEIWGDGSVIRDFVFIEDVVDALLAAAADRSNMRVFNIGTGRGRSLCEVMAAVEQLTGGILKIDLKPAHHFDVPVSVVAIDRAREVLQWTPKTSFEDGLAQTIRWWQSGAADRAVAQAISIPSGPRR